MTVVAVCSVCHRGQEDCSYCDGAAASDWAAMCDCGLYKFGTHLTHCDERREFRYVIAQSQEESELTA